MQGQWKQISRYYVPSRTPTQVASHAQKHFLRVNGATKRRSRFSTLEENVQQLSGVTSPQNRSGGRSSGGGANSATTGSCAKLQGTPAATPPPSFPLAREYSLEASKEASVLPPNADGLAIGVPWTYHTPMISTPNGKLPLLRVHPGRIDVTKMSTSNGENSKLTYPKLRSPVDPSPKRKMEALKMGDDSKGHLAVLHEISQRLKAESMRTKRRRQHEHQLQHHSPRSSEFADSECGEHGDTSAALSALDALAGVAAALADSD